MVLLPVRKCFYVAKVTVVILVIVCLLAAFEKWRGGRRTVRAAQEPQEFLWEQEILADEKRIIPGLGEGGVAAELTGVDKELGAKSVKELAMNVYLSDRIAYNRTLKDQRNPACERVVYDAELPSASVIIIFHNEPYSVVLRTIWSVVNSARRDRPWYKRANFRHRDTGKTMNLGYPGQDPSSPFVYLKEIILVDDNSTLPELKGKLSYYIRTRLPPDLIRIIRLPERGGVTRARFEGSKQASGAALVFLDSHCEALRDWLRPLLHRVKQKRSAVLAPVIDVIDCTRLNYQPMALWDNFKGLMIARMRGARSARGDVLIFLDAHCEAGADWLRPLLQRITHKRDAVLTPLIDVVDQTTFQLEAAHDFQVGGFTFLGHYTWIDVPEREKRRRGSDIAPTWSPTMAGGLFAINREYYWEIGAYDEQMAGWGGENLEMSFRVWQCGGTLEAIPCSRVGHVFRSFHPYAMPANSDTHGINTARMAEVWMDDYKELFYLHRPDLRKSPKIGDVTHRKVLREKLQCKDFDWYLQHVYKEKFVPVRDSVAYGRFRNPATGLCLDTMQREDDAAPLGLYPCHDTLQGTQYLSLALDGQLRDEERCVELQHVRDTDDDKGRKLLMFTCSKNRAGQKWRYTSDKQLVHVATGLCLEAAGGAGADAAARRCRRGPAQRWSADHDERATAQPEAELSSLERSLQRLRGRRRISRSLLAYDDSTGPPAGPPAPPPPAAPPAPAARRRHGHKKRKHSKLRKHGKAKRSRSKTKNKFILKLVRTLMNNSEEHLEVEISCRHQQLFPNNSFVRDLVTILNEKNIKVINNGRVFERNRVTELGAPARHKKPKVLDKLEVKADAPAKLPMRPPARPPAPPPAPLALSPMPKEMAHTRSGQAAPALHWPGGGRKRKQKQRGGPLVINMQPQQPRGLMQNNMVEADYNNYNKQEQKQDKKIIIEDFVEVKKKRKKHKTRTEDEAAQPLVLAAALAPAAAPALAPAAAPAAAAAAARKRQRDRAAAAAAPAPGPDYEDEAPAAAPAPPHQSSLEEVPMLSSELAPESSVQSKRTVAVGDNNIADSDERERDGDSDRYAAHDWYNDDAESRYANHETRRQRIDAFDTMRSPAPAPADGGAEPAPEPEPRDAPGDNVDAADRRDTDRPERRSNVSPLKVVMKSNLTFNLGDEFFSWRAKDDVNDVLGELAIPLNTSRAPPPLHAWVRPPSAGPAPPPAPAGTGTPASSSDDSSSSSESGDTD